MAVQQQLHELIDTRAESSSLVLRARASVDTRPLRIGVVGLGYVGLPTALALHAGGAHVIGLDVNPRRRHDIRALNVDLLASDLEVLEDSLDKPDFELADGPGAISTADAVLICVPTPVDEQRRPDLRAIKGACAMVVAQAVAGQTLILTSTSYVGTTRDLLVEPLKARGMHAGRDIFVAFSPERVDPGEEQHRQRLVPRVVGGDTADCSASAALVLDSSALELQVVSSPEAAELTKLSENTFRAVNIALAYELADAARRYGLDPLEVTRAAATKPYGYMPFYPGAGVGGHCIPCDPHYLLAPVEAEGGEAPIIRQAMDAIATRPQRVADRCEELLFERGIPVQLASVLVVGAAYKPNVQDVRESPAVDVMRELRARGATLEYHDPLVPSLDISESLAALSVSHPTVCDYDLVVVITVHRGQQLGWLRGASQVLDCTYRHGSDEGWELL